MTNCLDPQVAKVMRIAWTRAEDRQVPVTVAHAWIIESCDRNLQAYRSQLLAEHCSKRILGIDDEKFTSGQPGYNLMAFAGVGLPKG